MRVTPYKNGGSYPGSPWRGEVGFDILLLSGAAGQAACKDPVGLSRFLDTSSKRARMATLKQVGMGLAILATIASMAHAGPGPDIAVCSISDLTQYGREGAVGSGTVGLAFGTSHYNAGTVGILWASAPSTNHPLLTQNLYRLMTVNGAARFEQIGQAWVFNSYCPLQNATCAVCNPDTVCGPTLGAGCATPHSAGSHASQGNLSSRGFVNPFTGVYPSSLNSHAHAHTPISHRLQVDDVDLALPGAIYFGESHAVTRDDATSGNQDNNVGYRRFHVTGPSQSGTFGFPVIGGTVSEAPAIYAWTTATHVVVAPTPGTDGELIVAYEVTPLVSGGYHYEYAVYNMNNDAAVGGFSVPVELCATVTNVGFHAVKNHAPEADAPSYSNDAWEVTQSAGEISWATEAFAANPNANAIRWGTMYNFRFDAAEAPVAASASISLFKTGGSASVAILAPGAAAPIAADINADCLADDADVLTLVDVLLGVDADEVHVARADVDGSGGADGVDISAFVAAYLVE